jgi:predicted RNA binding protein YcfA (HicA-like mRNA interferase family)
MVEAAVTMRVEMKRWRRLAQSQGWRVAVTAGNHLAWRSPAGQTVYTPSTPSDQRGLLNARARLRRAGLQI